MLIINQQQYHLFTDYPGEQLPGIIVPQLVWFNPQAPHTHPLPPVRFTAYGHNGVSIANLLNTPPAGMPDAATIPQLGGAQRISFRVCVGVQLLANYSMAVWANSEHKQWPGYSAWSLAINTFSNAANGGPHNKGRIAVSVANAIRQFLLVRSIHCLIILTNVYLVGYGCCRSQPGSSMGDQHYPHRRTLPSRATQCVRRQLASCHLPSTLNACIRSTFLRTSLRN